MLTTLNQKLMTKLVDEASKNRHYVDKDDEEGDFVEMTTEMKEALEKHDWISSK